ncbi:MAG: 30S ribosome-binding factor RbfA [Zetaproteobacteria bacterium]|nr:30S ribosome-binding factor RbfA [Zetaproteobacteria bacterium]
MAGSRSKVAHGSAHGRLHSDLQRLLCVLMQRDMDDPTLQGLSVTRLELAKSNDVAKVYIHRMGEHDPKACIQRLQRLTPHFEHELRQAMSKRKMPSLHFYWDDAFDASSLVLDTLRSLRE